MWPGDLHRLPCTHVQDPSTRTLSRMLSAHGRSRRAPTDTQYLAGGCGLTRSHWLINT
jgi:hypothetical protein